MVQITLLEISEMTKLTLVTFGFQTVAYALRNGLLLFDMHSVLFMNNFGLIERKKETRNVYRSFFATSPGNRMAAVVGLTVNGE
jgi:hypothetical protein